ncbi:MAG: hypothetical protein WD042_19065 [Phycisphaeraceae bacterium]
MRLSSIHIALVLLALVWTLPGCNTVRGIGKDIHDSAMNVQVFMEDDDANYEHIPPASSASARP